MRGQIVSETIVKEKVNMGKATELMFNDDNQRECMVCSNG